MKNFFFAILLSISFSYVHSQQKIEHPAPEKRQQIVHHKHYSLSFNKPYGVASWVAYELTAEEAKGSMELTNVKLVPDPQLPNATSSKKDYKGSGFVPGFLASPHDMGFSEEALLECQYITNASPFKPYFNTGLWYNVGELVRYWAQEYGAVYVVTGTVTTETPYSTIGKNKIIIPKTFYKVVMDTAKTKAIGFVLPNRNSTSTLSSFAVGVDNVEELTGIDFFPLLEDELEEKLEYTFHKDEWIWEIPE